MKKTHRLRVLIVAFLSMLAFAGIEARLYVVQVHRHAKYVAKAQKQQKKTITLSRRRGDILDRNGQILATSTFYDTIYFNSSALEAKNLPATSNDAAKSPDARHLPPGTARRIARVLAMPEARVEEIFHKKGRTLLARKVPPEVADALRVLEDDLGLPDDLLSFDKESKRLYPQGDLAGPVVGYTKIDDYGDNIGQEALELQFDRFLSGENKKQRIPVNSWRQGLAPMDEAALQATYGNSLVLTLDSQVQHYAQQALRKRVGEVQAEGGAVVVMDVKSGGILALASCPDFDPNQFAKAKSVQRRNRSITDPFEIGSVMKILTSAILLDNNLLRPDEMVDCQGGNGFVDGRHFKDSHPLGVVPFRLAFAESSNIAAAKLGLRLEKKLYYDSLKKFGLGTRLGMDLPGENRGVLRDVSQWTRETRTSLPVGYETAMTALQVTTALAAIANGGMRMRPHIVQKIISAEGRTIKEFPPEETCRVVRPETCKTMLELMEAVVSEGTGASASVPGYTCAGKTGTTRKVMEGKHYIASFAGVLPAREPQIAVYIYIEEPNPEIEFYGGKVAAPVFSEIAKNAVRVLGIPPDKPEDLKLERNRASASKDAGVPDAKGENVDGYSDEADMQMAKHAALAGRELALASTLASMADQPEDVSPAPAPPPAGKSMEEKKSVAPSPEERERMLQVRIRAEHAAREIKPGIMPLCLGLTMSEVLQIMAKTGIRVSLEGSGLAVAQDPPSGTSMSASRTGRVTFTLPSRRMNEHAPDIPAAAKPGPEPKG